MCIKTQLLADSQFAFSAFEHGQVTEKPAPVPTEEKKKHKEKQGQHFKSHLGLWAGLLGREAWAKFERVRLIHDFYLNCCQKAYKFSVL